ncbi:MAG TPA: NAD(P)/FAD-dependent oxidoreductase [Acidimicrobiia bacterium]|jgi:protoporphyrinogen oxidase
MSALDTIDAAEADRSGTPPSVVIIGAGPAGLTAAYMLTKRGLVSTVLEADSVVGGISRTVERDGWRFDIGGHRFFTKVTPVDDLWFEILGEDEFLRRPRMSHIYYDGKLYDYPIKPMNALRNLGLREAVRCVASYGAARVRPPKDQTSLENYIVANYGWRLYDHFFKTYNEKVWGVPASELGAEFGAQRIKGMSLFDAVWEPVRTRMMGDRRDKSKQVTSLIEEFNYPKYGPGQMWEKAAELVTAAGTKIEMSRRVSRIHRDDRGAIAVTAENDGAETRYECTHVISSMPMSGLLRAIDPPAPPEVLAAANGLTYRDFMTVALVVPQEYSFPDNWIYIHDPGVSVGRIQNFGSWSPYLVKEGRTCLGLEFFVNEGDSMWTKSDAELVEQAKREIDQLGLADASRVEAGYVVRMPKAYPVYDEHYKNNVAVMRAWLDEHCPNVFPVGRNGMHRYNNQDHSMYTAMLSVENILGAEHDVWSVNVEDEYHEEAAASVSGERGTGRDAPVMSRSSIEAAAARRRAKG